MSAGSFDIGVIVITTFHPCHDCFFFSSSNRVQLDSWLLRRLYRRYQLKGPEACWWTIALHMAMAKTNTNIVYISVKNAERLSSSIRNSYSHIAASLTLDSLRLARMYALWPITTAVLIYQRFSTSPSAFAIFSNKIHFFYYFWFHHTFFFNWCILFLTQTNMF